MASSMVRSRSSSAGRQYRQQLQLYETQFSSASTPASPASVRRSRRDLHHQSLRRQASFHHQLSRQGSLPASQVYAPPVSTPQKCKQFCKKFSAIIFSRVGLIALVIGYAVGGAFIFQAMEGPHEDKETSVLAFSRNRNTTLSNMWRIAEELNVFNRSLWFESIETHIKDFQSELVHKVREEGYDGTLSSQWTFSGSFLFALTVITTIGEYDSLIFVLSSLFSCALFFSHLDCIS